MVVVLMISEMMNLSVEALDDARAEPLITINAGFLKAAPIDPSQARGREFIYITFYTMKCILYTIQC